MDCVQNSASKPTTTSEYNGLEVGSTQKREGRKILRKQLQIATEENEALKQKLSEQCLEIDRLSGNVSSLKDIIRSSHGDGLGKGSNLASCKITELSRRNRSLVAELEVTKSKCVKMEQKVAQMELELVKKSTKEVDESCSKNLPCCEAARSLSSFSEQLQVTKQKLFEALNQNKELRNNLKLAQKCIQQEIGENVTLNMLASAQPTWRGRSQQIIALQNKVAELKEKVELAGFGDEPYKNELRRLENMRREEMEVSTRELKECKTTIEVLKSKIAALKVRNKILADEAMSYKIKSWNIPGTSGENGHSIELLTEKIRIQKFQYEGQLAEFSRKVAELEKQKKDALVQASNLTLHVEHLKKTSDEKQQTIDELNFYIKRLEDDLRSTCGDFLFSCRDLRKEEFIAILDSLESEKQGLVEQVASLNKRLNVERDKIKHLSDQLAKQKVKFSRLEAKNRDIQKQLNSQSERRKRTQRMADYTKQLANRCSNSTLVVENSKTDPLQDPANGLEVQLEDVKNKLELSTEQVKFLQEKVVQLTQEKEEDSKMFNEILANSKFILLKMIQQANHGDNVKNNKNIALESSSNRVNSNESNFGIDCLEDKSEVSYREESKEQRSRTSYIKFSPKRKMLDFTNN